MSYTDLVALIFSINLATGMWAFFPDQKVRGQNRSGDPTYERFSHSQAFVWLLSAGGWALFSTVTFVAVLL